MPKGNGGALGKKRVEVGKGIPPLTRQQLPWTPPSPRGSHGRHGPLEGKAPRLGGPRDQGPGERQRVGRHLLQARKLALFLEEAGAPVPAMPKEEKMRFLLSPRK